MKIHISENPCDFDISDVVLLGKRTNNPKRKFLFVSKLLGKHIPVNPAICKVAGYLLVALAYDLRFVTKMIATDIKKGTLKSPEFYNVPAVEDKTIVLGFCETATGLGMAVASAIRGCVYQITTREEVMDVEQLFSFEEEHSHATTHRCYSSLNIDFNDFNSVTLVDDEITTGNSMLNIIKEINKISGIKKYRILTILDWRDEEHLSKYETFCKENDIEIEVVAAIRGTIENTSDKVYIDTEEPVEITEENEPEIIGSLIGKVTYHNNEGKEVEYFSDSGRFGTTYNKIKDIDKDCALIAKKIDEIIDGEKKVLVMGHGENIFIPSRIASMISAEKVDFRTTSRSPIFVDGEIIKDKQCFYDRGVKYYFYNKKDAEEYDVVIMLTETPMNKKLCKNMITIQL